MIQWGMNNKTESKKTSPSSKCQIEGVFVYMYDVTGVKLNASYGNSHK